MEFNRDAQRWQLDTLWSGVELLDQPPNPYCPLKLEQVRKAAGSMDSDVGWRDYRLVQQADCLAVFNPVFNNADKVSRGVMSEVGFATSLNCPVYYYQDPKHDTDGIAKKQLQPTEGSSMGDGPGPTLITKMESVEAMLEAIA